MCCLQTKLTIQQKFRFLEISKLQVPKGTAHYDPIQGTARLVIVLVSSIQQSGTGYSNFPNAGKEPSWPINLDHLQRCSQIFRSDRTEMIRMEGYKGQYCDAISVIM